MIGWARRMAKAHRMASARLPTFARSSADCLTEPDASQGRRIEPIGKRRRWFVRSGSQTVALATSRGRCAIRRKSLQHLIVSLAALLVIAGSAGDHALAQGAPQTVAIMKVDP